MLNLPFLCNYRCLKCCNLKDEVFIKRSGSYLSINDIQTLLEEAGEADFKVLVIAGEGEPMLNKEFKTVVKHASKNGLLPYIFTNGSYLNEENIEFLAEHRASLIINLDSLDPVNYARLSGKNGNLKKVLSNIEQCRKVYSSLQEITPFGKVVSLAINTVVTRINVSEPSKIKHFCSDDIVFVCNRPTRIGFAEKNWKTLYGYNFEDTEIDKVIDEYSKDNGPLGSTSDGKWCAYMKNGVSIGADGSILSCAYATDTAGFYGFYQKGKLKQINAYVMKSVDSFYSKYGHSRCILRHPNYQMWINETKNLYSVAELAAHSNR